MPKDTTQMNLTNLPVDDRTKQSWEEMKNESRKANAVLFQSLIIFAVREGFDPVRCDVSWEDGE